MKARHFLTRIVLLWLVLPLPARAQELQRALLIGVSRYDTGTGWVNLHAYNDLACLKKALIASGFPASSIVTVDDTATTKAGIVGAIREQLLNRVTPGMHVYLHFSGHGQSLQDTDGDEADGYDEALVPCNAGSRFVPGIYEGKHHLSDDELAELFQAIRKKAGSKGSFFCTVDACHSGGVSRGVVTAVPRGSGVPIAASGYRPVSLQAEEERFEIRGGADQDLAPFSLMTASRPYQLAYEDPEKQTGAFSLALSTVLLRHPGTLNYQQLYELVRAEMAGYTQDPTLEGNKSGLVFGGGLKALPAYYPLSRKTSDSVFDIDAGSLAGFLTGSVARVYRGLPGDTAAGNVVGEARVLRSTAFTASLKADQQLPKDNPQKLWVYPERILGNSECLKLELRVKHPSLRAAILRQAKRYPGIALTPEPGCPYILSDSLSQSEYRLQIQDPGGNILDAAGFPHPPDSLRLETWLSELNARAYFWNMADNLLKSSLSSPEIKPRLQILRSGAVPDENKTLARELAPGDQILFKVINQGRMACYYTIINIASDKKPYVCIPGETDSPEDYYLKPYSEQTVNTQFLLTEPAGKETYILICSSEPLDLRRQIMDNPDQTRSSVMANPNPLNSVVPAAGATRGGQKVLKISTHTILIHTLSTR